MASGVTSALVALFGLTLLLNPVAVSARTISTTTPNFLLDNFSELQYGVPWTYNMFNPTPQPDWGTHGYWWPMVNSGYFERDYNMPCSSSGTECVVWGQDPNGKGYVRMTVSPYVPNPAIPGEYHEAALTETNHGFSYADQKRWLPEVGKPVIVTATMRWSDNFNVDGTGFVGTSGLYLWNMPADYINGVFHGPKAIGIDLMSANMEVPEFRGLGLTVIDVPGDTTLYNKSDWTKIPYTRNIDLTRWMLFNMEWSVNAQGEQKVKFWINGEKVGQKTLAQPLPALAIELWNDNYLIKDTGTGYIYPTTEMINAEQSYDIGFISVFKL